MPVRWRRVKHHHKTERYPVIKGGPLNHAVRDEPGNHIHARPVVVGGPRMIPLIGNFIQCPRWANKSTETKPPKLFGVREDGTEESC